MKKTYTLILLIIAVGFLVGCTIISTSNEDHEQLSERLLELDLEQKDYYQVNIEVTTAIAFDRYFLYVCFLMMWLKLIILPIESTKPNMSINIVKVLLAKSN